MRQLLILGALIAAYLYMTEETVFATPSDGSGPWVEPGTASDSTAPTNGTYQESNSVPAPPVPTGDPLYDSMAYATWQAENPEWVFYYPPGMME